jgi:predicted nucleic-acid-binding Zn-ribbon protein
MNPAIREQVRFVLDDDNELMTAALDEHSDLDAENKRLNRLLIKRHEAILAKLENEERLTQEDLRLVRDANEIHLNDEGNVAGHHKEAVELDEWLGKMLVSREKPAFDDEGKCLKCGSKVSFADVTDTVVFVGEEIVKRYDGDITNRNCVRCNYPELYADFKQCDEGD